MKKGGKKMKTLRKRFVKNPNTVEAYACTSATCDCNPAYCAATWESQIDPTRNRVSANELHLVKVGVKP